MINHFKVKRMTTISAIQKKADSDITKHRERISDLCLMIVADVFDCEEAKILSRCCLKRECCDARHALYALTKHFAELTVRALNKHFGSRSDHRAMEYALKAHVDKMNAPDYAAKYNEAKRIIEEINA